MKAAVSYNETDGNVFFHFGETPAFKIYDIENDKIVQTEIVETAPYSHGALVGFLKERGVQMMICGHIGNGARNKLDAAGIEFYGDVSGNADEAVERYLNGTLESSVGNNTHGVLS